MEEKIDVTDLSDGKRIITTYYDAEKTKIHKRYVADENNEKVGLYEEYHENGRIALSVMCEDNEKEGRETLYDEDGVVRGYITYSKGIENGPFEIRTNTKEHTWPVVTEERGEKRNGRIHGNYYKRVVKGEYNLTEETTENLVFDDGELISGRCVSKKHEEYTINYEQDKHVKDNKVILIYENRHLKRRIENDGKDRRIEDYTYAEDGTITVNGRVLDLSTKKHSDEYTLTFKKDENGKIHGWYVGKEKYEEIRAKFSHDVYDGPYIEIHYPNNYNYLDDEWQPLISFYKNDKPEDADIDYISEDLIVHGRCVLIDPRKRFFHFTGVIKRNVFGDKWNTYNVQDGSLDGPIETWWIDEDGRECHRIGEYHKSDVKSRFTGMVVMTKNGKLSEKVLLENDLHEGICEKFDDDGNPVSRIVYHKDQYIADVLESKRDGESDAEFMTRVLAVQEEKEQEERLEREEEESLKRAREEYNRLYGGAIELELFLDRANVDPKVPLEIPSFEEFFAAKEEEERWIEKANAEIAEAEARDQWMQQDENQLVVYAKGLLAKKLGLRIRNIDNLSTKGKIVKPPMIVPKTVSMQLPKAIKTVTQNDTRE